MITEIRVAEQLWHIMRHFGTMRHGVLTAMKARLVHWDAMLHSAIDECQHFGRLYVKDINRGSRFLQNGGAYQETAT
jgi:hypothetical protein